MVIFISNPEKRKKLLLNISHFQNLPPFPSAASPRCFSVRLNGFNNRSASCNLVCWTFYLSAGTKLSLSSLFQLANVIECCALTTKVIICAWVCAISLVPITSQPDRTSLHTPKSYLCYLGVWNIDPQSNILTHFCPKSLKGNKRLTFCAVWSGFQVDRSVQNWEAGVEMQLLLRTHALVHVTCTSIRLAPQSKPSAPLCPGALQQIRHPEGFYPKSSSYWLYSSGNTILSAASSDGRKEQCSWLLAADKAPFSGDLSRFRPWRILGVFTWIRGESVCRTPSYPVVSLSRHLALWEAILLVWRLLI